MSTPTTALGLALSEAGIAPKSPTRMEVIWRAIKESGQRGITVREMKKHLRAIPEGSIASVCSQMEKRAMIYSRGTKGYGPTGTAKQFLTDMERYELLPLPPEVLAAESKRKRKYATKSRAAGNGYPSSPKANPAPAKQAAQAAPESQSLDAFIESLTVAQARALYRKLERMFSAKD